VPTLGRKPSGNDIGFGYLAAGLVRGTIAGRVSANGWLYLFGARVGNDGDGNATYAQAIYEASGTTITAKLGGSGNAVAATVMTWGGEGANQTVKPTAPIKVRTGIDYALPIRTISGTLVHGQDNSGALMHDRAISSFPDPFGATSVRPEGRLSTWAEIQNNRAPKTPTGLFPAAGATVTASPTLGADFRDDDEVLPGFALGQADKVKSYRFEVWNQQKTSRLRDSGVLAATGAQQTARRVTWMPATLTPGTYVARCTVYDQFDTPSPQAEWTFTINSGGAVSVAITPAQIAGEQNGWPVTNRTAQPGNDLVIATTWSHGSGYAAVAANLRVKAAGGSVVRPETQVAISVPSGSGTTFTITAGSGNFAAWAALTRGQRYSIEAQLQDSTGGWSVWATTGQFLVNAAPGTPTSALPTSGAFGDYPELSALIADPNDDSAALVAEFAVRPAGDAGNGVVIPFIRRSYGDGRHYGQPNATEMPDYGDYQWRVRGVDPWGLAGEWTTWQTFTYAEPPQITVTSPAPDAVIATGTPTISFTVDRSIVSYSIRIWNAATNALVYEFSSSVSGSSASHQVASGILRNQITYRTQIEVTAVDGMSGWVDTFFTIQYPAFVGPGGMTAVRIPGPFEASQPPSTWSQIEVSWNPVSQATAPDEEFKGYVLYLTDIGTGEETMAAVITSRSETSWVFRTPTSGHVYQFGATYLREINEVDTVESQRSTAELGVNLIDTTIITLDEDAIGAPLRFWEERGADWITDVEVVPSWTEHPIGFQGSTNSNVVSGTFMVMDDEWGSYTARDIVAAVRSMAGPKQDADGRLRPRVISYRDPKGRNLVVMFSRGRETDHHVNHIGEMSLTFTQVAVEIGAVYGTAGVGGL